MDSLKMKNEFGSADHHGDLAELLGISQSVLETIRAKAHYRIRHYQTSSINKTVKDHPPLDLRLDTAVSLPIPPEPLTHLFRLVLSPDNRDSFIGDLEERYGAILQHEGHCAASRWFWRQVVHSFFSLAFDALKRLSALEKLIERYRRIGS